MRNSIIFIAIILLSSCSDIRQEVEPVKEPVHKITRDTVLTTITGDSDCFVYDVWHPCYKKKIIYCDGYTATETRWVIGYEDRYKITTTYKNGKRRKQKIRIRITSKIEDVVVADSISVEKCRQYNLAIRHIEEYKEQQLKHKEVEKQFKETQCK